MKRVLVDTGPLVAILSPHDEHHEICVRTLEVLPGPLVTCWPVITEALWLVRGHPEVGLKLLRKIGEGLLQILALGGSEATGIAEIMEKYTSLRPQLGDAALIYLAKREGILTIFTLDRRDFSVYRTARNRPFRLLPELR